MKILTCTFVAAAALLLQVGCNTSKSTSQSTPNSTSQSQSTPAASSSPEDAGEQNKAADVSNAQSPATSPATTVATSEKATPEKAATDAPTKESPTKESEKAAKAPDELIAGIKNPRLVAGFEQVKKQADDNPTDWNAQLQYVNILQVVGQERIRNNESEKGFKTFATSAEVARKFLETKAEVPELAHNLLANVFYNDACVASRAKNSQAAMASMEDAIKWGFSDLAMLEQDEDLAALRADAGFSEKLEKWKQAARERALKKAKDELAAAKSFPFDFSLTDVDGKPIKLADFHGKVVIADIWGTWCPPCRAEIPSFVKLQSTYGEKGFQMVGLNEENESGEEAVKLIKGFMKEQGMNYPCALIDESTKSQVPDFEGYPTTLFIDRSGKVRLKAVGLHEYSYLEAIVTTLLEEPAPAATPPAATPAAATPAAATPAAATPDSTSTKN